MKIPSREKLEYKNISMRLPEKIHERARRYAKAKNLQLGEIVELLLSRQMDSEKFEASRGAGAD